MRAIIKLLAVGAVIAVFALGHLFDVALDYQLELAIGGAALLVIVAFAISRIDRVAIADTTPAKAPITAKVRAIEPPRALDDDVEGMTVPAKLSPEQAYQLHQRYAPSFDQQLALNRHLEQHGDEPWAPGDPRRSEFDQQRYEQAMEYAVAFDEQLGTYRNTCVHQVPPPPTRLARGSFTEHLNQREPTPLESQPEGWDPHKPPSVTGMRRVK